MTLVSLVTGTFNRLDHLRAMIESAREALPVGDYEIIVVDGGSTDGTLDYCRAQDDVVLIEHGALRGAIRAFTDGGNAAKGTYTLLANDDIVFPKREAIFRAIRHLEQTQTCGAVAFGDNRPQRGYTGRGYKVNLMPVVDRGRPSHRPYAQVGLFRTALAKRLGWWGADDPCMSAAAAGTYGGDNWLSARIWEAGYTVDVVKGVYCADNMVEDELRAHNYALESLKPNGYYRCYPNGPVVAPPIQGEATDPVMRILYLPIFETGPFHAQQRKTKRGLREALQRVGHVWEIDYLNAASLDLVECVAAWQPDLILSQLHGPFLTPAQIRHIRAQAPSALWVNWNGDAHLHGLTSERVLHMVREFDLQLVVNAFALPLYRERGVRAAYWQVGYEDCGAGDADAYDVVFLANAYNAERKAIEDAVRGMTGVKAGFFGQNWARADGQNLYDFAAGEGLYRRCKIALADCWNPEQNVAFTSNRLIQALGAGAFVLQQTIPALDEYTHFRAGEHYETWNDLDDLPEKITYWLDAKRATKRKAIGRAGQVVVRAHYTFDALVQQLLDVIIPEALDERT